MNIKPIYLYILIAVLIFLLFRQCDKNTELRQSDNSEKEFLNDSISYYKNKLGREVAEKVALKGNNSTLEILLSKQIDSTGQLKRLVKEFRNVDAAGNITQEVRIDTVKVPYLEGGPTLGNLEYKFGTNTQYYSIFGRTTQEGITIDSLSLPNTLSFAIGKKKTGFFKSEYRIEAVNSNPYISTIGLDAYTFSVPKKRFGISAYVGFGIGQNLTLNPQIGIGISYSLIRF